MSDEEAARAKSPELHAKSDGGLRAIRHTQTRRRGKNHREKGIRAAATAQGLFVFEESSLEKM
jgi:hypothetical protein